MTGIGLRFTGPALAAIAALGALWFFAPERHGGPYWRFASWIERPVDALGRPVFRPAPAILPNLTPADCQRFEGNVVTLGQDIGNFHDPDVAAVGYLGPSRGDWNLAEAFNQEVDIVHGEEPDPAGVANPRRTRAPDEYFSLPLRHLTDKERLSLCRAILRMRSRAGDADLYITGDTFVVDLWKKWNEDRWAALIARPYAR